MKEGYYYDPWNPFCGFIRCRLVESADRKPRMVATRELCREGTWVSDQSQVSSAGSEASCGHVSCCSQASCIVRLPFPRVPPKQHLYHVVGACSPLTQWGWTLAKAVWGPKH